MKKLTLSKSKDSKLFGVCGGIANYFEVDVTIVRLICLALSLCVIGIIPYFVAAIVMPNHSENT